ncbi:RNA exonuclease 3 [Coniosporium apollinis]|uniref:RNA exonuclease 3 n=1 Tax=Coniosporium apollinis TaxID=61459 RepID=A0ABQ9NNG1_9PEZI|nr:RNA exonuclease 3 [Coniosporium apollinis]
MFSAAGLFKNIRCPEGALCRVPNCIFSHQSLGNDEHTQQASSVRSDGPVSSSSSTHAGHDAKRRKLDETDRRIPVANGHLKDDESKKPFVGAIASKEPTRSLATADTANGATSTVKTPSQGLKTATRPVSPPPRSEKVKVASATLKKAVQNDHVETLNPRMVKIDPAGHGLRRLYLSKLHEGMARLNDVVSKSTDPEVKALHLSNSELIKLALDEEEGIANGKTSVYGNIIKLRMVAYKNMKLEEWVRLRREDRARKEGKAKEAEPPPLLDTGLAPDEELLILPRLVANQEGLEQHGYVPSPPTQADIAAANEGVEAAHGYEKCDRCSTRFQVFPDRREDGALTSGGICTYHWGRVYRPPREKVDAIKGAREPKYTCCQEQIGTPGCTVGETHVFKISEAKRLAAVLPFERTSENPGARTDRAVAFDCEMGYTVYGLELIRLTATSWPDQAPLIDVLVRPLGAILDLNTRFSGVQPEAFFNAPPFDPAAGALPSRPPSAGTEAAPAQPTLAIVASPDVARTLLCSYISPSTPLLGHALENDLNVIRLCHPTIVDTVLLFPHPRGLPIRYGLRALVKKYLNKDIQTAGAAGHDSLEDAREAGELVRWRVAREWKRLKSEGWSVNGGQFFAPLVPGMVVKPATLEELRAYAFAPLEKRAKRGRGQVDGADEEREWSEGR